MEFIRFIEKYNIIGTSVGMIVGNSTSSFTNVLSDVLIVPVLDLINLVDKNKKVKIGDVEIEIGKLFAEFIKLLITLLILYLVLRSLPLGSNMTT